MKNLVPQLLGVLWVNTLQLSFLSRIASAAESHLANVIPLPGAADIWWMGLLEVYEDLVIHAQFRTTLELHRSSASLTPQSLFVSTSFHSYLSKGYYSFLNIVPLKFCIRVCFPEKSIRLRVSEGIGQKESKVGRTVARTREVDEMHAMRFYPLANSRQGSETTSLYLQPKIKETFTQIHES